MSTCTADSAFGRGNPPASSSKLASTLDTSGYIPNMVLNTKWRFQRKKSMVIDLCNNQNKEQIVRCLGQPQVGRVSGIHLDTLALANLGV